MPVKKPPQPISDFIQTTSGLYIRASTIISLDPANPDKTCTARLTSGSVVYITAVDAANLIGQKPGVIEK